MHPVLQTNVNPHAYMFLLVLYFLYLSMPVCISRFLSEPVNGVEILIRAHIRNGFIKEVHQTSSAVDLLCRGCIADP